MNDLSATDRCVKCGLCLPHCPTFALTSNEADSPRGRISLMQSIDQDSEWSPGLFQHLDRCLQCQACEAMCPSKVPFGHLMDTAKARLEPRRQRSWRQRLVRRAGLHLVASRRWNRALHPLLAAYQRCGLRWLIERLPGIPVKVRRLNGLLPDAPLQSPPAQRSAVGTRGSVHLFTGCLGDAFDRQTLQATRRLLERLGYQVNLSGMQRCCGALHQHNGEPGTAARLARANLEAFAADDHPVLATASGCTAHLREYDALYQHPQGRGFSARVNDVLHFLADSSHTDMEFASLPESVAVHVPCTHRNALQQERDIFDLLGRIPAIELLPVNPQGGCCGAAGSYMLSQPALSDRLGEQIADRIVASGARLLVTSNIGCSLQLRAALRQRGVAMEVLHPVALLERCLSSSSAKAWTAPATGREPPRTTEPIASKGAGPGGERL